ncbi:MAG: mannitol dehydrogenase family protein [Spirochaetaceae bacterium]|jgi:mannitol-1-phosphate/altronate dehydrogenase|nr:mannitol dehydrogenase family protein [Spirochaetaceae bacterium]
MKVSYDRKALKKEIVHIGLGHFHRAHEAYYLDTLLCKGLAKTGIREINLVKDPYPLAEIAGKQDYLYTLLARGASGNEDLQVIGAILDYINATDDKKEAISRAAAPETAVISMTITEKGYCYDFSKGCLDLSAPPIAHDLQNPGEPESGIGFLCAVLNKRKEECGLPITVISCDNFPQNGKTVKSCVLSFCSACKTIYPNLIPWIEANVAFPCSMVDRITPNTSPETIRYIEEKYHYRDDWAVACEDFVQWVLEDNFKIPENAPFDPHLFEKAGVQIVADVEPYEKMKMRLLNASHSALAYCSYLMGMRSVDEAATNPLVKKYIREVFMEEVTPTLPAVPGIDIKAYKDKLISRFSNKNIADKILRLAEDGSKKIPTYVLGPLEDAIKAGLPHQSMVYALASWARFLTGKDEQGKDIPILDPDGALVITAAQKAREEPLGFIETIGIHELNDLQKNELAKDFGAVLEDIYKEGTEKALRKLLK